MKHTRLCRKNAQGMVFCSLFAFQSWHAVIIIEHKTTMAISRVKLLHLMHYLHNWSHNSKTWSLVTASLYYFRKNNFIAPGSLLTESRIKLHKDMDYAYCTDFKRVLALVIGVVSHYVIWFDCFEYTIHQQVEKHFEEIEQFFLIKKQHLN